MALRFVAVLAGAASLSACTGGSGEVVTNTAVGRDDPGVTRDPPPSSRDNPGGACFVCDVNYTCSGPPPFGGSQLDLSTSDGSCTPSLIDVICSGTLFGASGCTGGGGGPFTCGETTCSPGSPQGSGVVGATAPGGTMTSPVPSATTGSMGSNSSRG